MRTLLRKPLHTMFAYAVSTDFRAKAAYLLRFRHCTVGHFSPDQFQFWLVTLPSYHLPDGDKNPTIPLRPKRAQRIAPRYRRKCSLAPHTSSTIWNWSGPQDHDGTRAAHFYKVPSSGSHSHTPLAGDGDFRSSGSTRHSPESSSPTSTL